MTSCLALTRLVWPRLHLCHPFRSFAILSHRRVTSCVVLVSSCLALSRLVSSCHTLCWSTVLCRLVSFCRVPCYPVTSCIILSRLVSPRHALQAPSSLVLPTLKFQRQRLFKEKRLLQRQRLDNIQLLRDATECMYVQASPNAKITS